MIRPERGDGYFFRQHCSDVREKTTGSSESLGSGCNNMPPLS
jgi:hypothetical protein